mmetsp:Transcript_82312/g.100986  ORF Transcript_82312/g.100986 Transcript_82312/m.100986 type:complete len:350 (+) Transcript_82312:383-1432(+)
MSRERRGNNLTRDEVDNLAKIQTRMVRVAMGEIPFEYPGSPNIKPGERYESNEIEKQFSSRARTLLYKNMFTFSFIGGSIPYLTISIMRRGGFNNALKNINKTTGVNVGKETPNIANNTRVKQPIFITTTCAVFGSFLGIMQARLDIAKEHLGLHGSPLATEARYQLWKLNPNHIYLREHQHEFEKFESYQRYSHMSDHIEEHVNPRMRPRMPKMPPPMGGPGGTGNSNRYNEEMDAYKKSKRKTDRYRYDDDNERFDYKKNAELKYKYGNNNNNYVKNYDKNKYYDDDYSDNYGNDDDRIRELKRKRFYEYREDKKPDNMYDENDHFNDEMYSSNNNNNNDDNNIKWG